jgi:hypothetical protein
VHEISAILATFEPPPQVVIVGYACNPRQGLINVGWGEAALANDHELHWYHTEDLPIPAEEATGDH